VSGERLIQRRLVKRKSVHPGDINPWGPRGIAVYTGGNIIFVSKIGEEVIISENFEMNSVFRK
jgi:hypothetical protein